MNLKLGKLPAVKDARNFKLAQFLRALPPIPTAWDFDLNSPLKIPSPMFANDNWGSCVVATRAHQTLRFEAFEQKKVLTIKDSEVLKEYWAEQGGNSKSKPDNGLNILESLKLWRKQGWKLGGNKYDIYAFAEVNHHNREEVKAAMFLLTGVYGGLMLPDSARVEFEAGKPWMTTTGAGSEPASWGGHCVLWKAFSSVGVTCKTWGRDQLMSWEFFWKYCDELYGIVDNQDRFVKNSPVDINKLAGFLKAVKN